MTELKFLCGMLKVSHDKSRCVGIKLSLGFANCSMFTSLVCVCRPFSLSSMFDGLDGKLRISSSR